MKVVIYISQIFLAIFVMLLMMMSFLFIFTFGLPTLILSLPMTIFKGGVESPHWSQKPYLWIFFKIWIPTMDFIHNKSEKYFHILNKK